MRNYYLHFKNINHIMIGSFVFIFRCKEQDIWNMSSGLSRPCSLSSFDNKYIKDMKLYSTNTILFKTWENATDGALMLPHPVEERRELDSGSPRLNERSNTHFPRRRVIKHAPKPLGLKPLPQLQLGYSKGLMVRAPDADKKQILIEERRINGPIQLGIYQSKSDELKPLILPSIRYIGIDKDDVQTYVSSKQMNLTLGPRGKSMHGTFAPLTAPDKKDAKEPRPSPELKMIGNAPGKSSIVETARTAPTGPDPTPRVEFDFKPDNNTEADSIINPVNIPSGYSHT